MWDWVKSWFVEPTTDAALGGLAKTCGKLGTVVRVHDRKGATKSVQAQRLQLATARHYAERDKAEAAFARIDRLVNGE